jgi:hypothetical protein
MSIFRRAGRETYEATAEPEQLNIAALVGPIGDVYFIRLPDLPRNHQVGEPSS